MSDETRGYLLGLIAVVLFAGTLPAARIAVVEMDPIMVGLGRAILAALVAGTILLATRQRLPQGSEWRQLALLASGVVFGFPFLSAWAMQHVPAAHGGVVLGILPLATAVFGALIGGERPSVLFWLFAVIGSAAVVVYALLDGPSGIEWADLALLLAVIAASFGYAIGARLSKSLGGWQVSCWALVISLPLLIPPVAWSYNQHGMSGGWQSWTAFLYVALISQLFAFFAWYRALALGGIAKVGQVQLLQTFFTLFFSWLLVGETLGYLTLGFAVLVVAVVAAGRRLRVAR